jgi:hypothetical protein
LRSVRRAAASKFGQVQIGIDNPENPSTLTASLDFEDTWHFAAGAQQQLSPSTFWGFALEYVYRGTLDTELRSRLDVEKGGRGDLVGSYEDTGAIFAAAYFSWTF